MISVLLLSGALASTAFAQLSYKLFFVRGHRRSLLIRALALFGIAQIGFFLALTRIDVGFVYMSTGLVHILVLALSWYVLEEAVGRDHMIAVALIVTGLLLYAA